MLPPGVEVIPPEIRKILSCNCQASGPCSKGNCTCRTANIGCSIFCKCSILQNCMNQFTVKSVESNDAEANEDEDEEKNDG